MVRNDRDVPLSGMLFKIRRPKPALHFHSRLSGRGLALGSRSLSRFSWRPAAPKAGVVESRHGGKICSAWKRPASARYRPLLSAISSLTFRHEKKISEVPIY